MTIHEYYSFKPRAWRAIAESYDRLARENEVMVLEGAGSPAEINLRDNDLVNMRMADYADAVVVLVADIERGGAFAQLIGTWELLEPTERVRIVGFVINKFRGDADLLKTGLEYVQERTGLPVLGILPFDPMVQLDEEDSLGLPATQNESAEVEVAVIRLPGISNFTDFASLSRLPHLVVRYVREPNQLHGADLILLPGTRTTLRALKWLKTSGLAGAISQRAEDASGPVVLGLCGGFQLLGRVIDDPQGVESSPGQMEGLGLLDIDTCFEARKKLFRIEGDVIGVNSLCFGCPVVGYEVHQGTSHRRNGVSSWLRFRRQPGGEVVEDGAVGLNGRVAGTYVHGLFDDARFCRALVATLRSRRGLAPLQECEWLSQRDYWASRYSRLGGWLTEHCDLRPVAKALGLSTWNS